jgi:hypothetical protein
MYLRGDDALVGPFWDPEITKRSWVQTQWCPGEGSLAGSLLPMSLTWGCRLLVRVRSAVVLQKKKFRRCNEQSFI